MHSGNRHTVTVISVSNDSTSVQDVPSDEESTFQVGLRGGYKTGNFSFGIGFNYGTHTLHTHALDPAVIPTPVNYTVTDGSTVHRYDGKTEGEMTTKTSTITITPFLRYNYLNAGDVSLFLELNGVYSMVNNPQVTCSRQFVAEGVKDPIPMADTSFTQYVNVKEFGARLIPGMSWQLNKHFSLDLYLDFLSIAYSSLSTTTTSYKYEYTQSADHAVTERVVTQETSTTVRTTTMDWGIFGNPDWAAETTRNFVRVGINFVF